MICLLATKPFYAAQFGWADDIRDYLGFRDTYAVTLAEMAARFVNLYANVRAQTVELHVALEQLLELDTELQVWEDNLPAAWHPTAIPASDADYAFANTVQHYHDFWLARMITNYRWTRILLNNLILMSITLTQSELDKRPYIQTSTRLSEDICYSVPYFLEPYAVLQTQQSPFPVLAGSFVVIFPLAVVGCSIGNGDTMVEYANRMLRMLGGKIGIFAATALIDKVAELRRQWAGFEGAL